MSAKLDLQAQFDQSLKGHPITTTLAALIQSLGIFLNNVDAQSLPATQKIYPRLFIAKVLRDYAEGFYNSASKMEGFDAAVDFLRAKVVESDETQ